MCSLAVDLRRVGQENGEPVVWNFGCGFFDIVDPVIVRIVDAGQIGKLTATRDEGSAGAAGGHDGIGAGLRDTARQAAFPCKRITAANSSVR